MNPSDVVHHGQHRPPSLQQHPRSIGVVQHSRPQTPRQSNPLPPNLAPTSQAPYYSPISSTSARTAHPSPLYALPSQQQTSGETSFFAAHPGQYSTNTAPPGYPPSDSNDNMAAQAAMGRHQYPPISNYQTPQSNSPASMNSPQTDAQGRPLYQMPAMQQQMYYSHHQYMQANPYNQHATPAQHHPISQAPGMLMSQPQAQHQMHQQPPPPPVTHHVQGQSGMVEKKPSPAPLQRPGSVVGQQHGTPQTPSTSAMHNMPPSSAGQQQQPQSAAPGPIPATTPLVVRQDHNGVQWIAFEYSRDRVKMEYTIRCDVESVDVEELSAEFKSANCVYPRACCGKDQYKGNRLHYESECNAVGWALAQLNPPLREKRGLIQRAVDSWRNSNQDMRLRSRRVRRMAKANTRKMNANTGGQVPGTPASATSGLQNSMPGPDYNSAPAHHHQAPPNAQAAMNTPVTQQRYTQSFDPTYPHHAQGFNALPPVQHSMGPVSMRPPSSALAVNSSSKEDEEEKRRMLFGDLPESKRRKFILVDDVQRGTRVRVRVMLDQINMDDMPDHHLKTNAVFPRSYYPRQMGSPGGSPRARSHWDDEDDESSGEPSARSKTVVPITLLDGGEAQMSVPRMTRSRRSKELTLNELGSRMAWSQARTFDGRTLFLQHSLDAYRNKMRSTMVSSGQEVATIAPHFETRPGKRKFLTDRGPRSKKADSL